MEATGVRRFAGPAALAVAVLATGVETTLVHPEHAYLRLALIVIGYAAFATMVATQRTRPFLTRKLVLGALVPLLAIAVVMPPRGSRDLWTYVMFGRIVNVHHENPFVQAPGNFGADPFLARTNPVWRHVPSVYGPAFVAVAVAVTAVTGDSPLASRLAFQLLAAGLALCCVLIVGRRTGDPGAMAWLAFNPLLVIFVVNAGHNDLLVGAAVLVAVLLAERQPVAAGLVLGLAGLVKIVAIVGLGALAVSVARRAGLRAGAVCASAGAAVVGTGYLLAGGMTALRPLRLASHWHTPASIAAALLALRPHIDAAAVCQLLLAVAIGVQVLRRRTEPWLVLSSVLLAYLLLAPYVLPWYAAWVLPVAALGWRSRLALVISIQTFALTVITVDSPAIAHGLHRFLDATADNLLPALEAIVAVVLVCTGWLQCDAPDVAVAVRGHPAEPVHSGR